MLVFAGICSDVQLRKGAVMERIFTDIAKTNDRAIRELAARQYIHTGTRFHINQLRRAFGDRVSIQAPATTEAVVVRDERD
jgi:hypothetical protein